MPKTQRTTGAAGRRGGSSPADNGVPPHATAAEFEALSDADKERVAAYYARGVRMEDTRPLTAAERDQWQRAKRRGRRPVGQGAERVSVTIERGLLARADTYAAAHDMTRAQLIAAGLRAVLTGGGRKDS